MKKEELLERLNDLKEQMKLTDLESVKSEKILEMKRNLENELATLKKGKENLTTKTVTDENVNIINKELSYLDIQIARLEQDKNKYQFQIDDADDVIETARFLIAEGTKEKEEYTTQMETVTDENKSELRDKITNTDNAIGYLIGRIEGLEKSNSEKREYLEKVEENLTYFNNAKTNKTNELNDLNERQSEIEIEVSDSDKNRIEAIKRIIKSIDVASASPYEFAQNFDEIIKGVEDDT